MLDHLGSSDDFAMEPRCSRERGSITVADADRARKGFDIPIVGCAYRLLRQLMCFPAQRPLNATTVQICTVPAGRRQN
jgi:hypothetical protein